MECKLILGDCLDVMAAMDANSVDAIVTDPPAGIAFMGKKWDTDHGGRDAWIANMTKIAAECLRVLKPGGHALVWALPRTSHWTATAWENAGFEVRDRVAHIFGSGFPKSADVSKHIDKQAGAEREVVGTKRAGIGRHGRDDFDVFHGSADESDKQVSVTAPATPAAAQWAGWGTALKPAMEDWWLLRKPFRGTVAANVLEWGTGAVNVDGCRVEGIPWTAHDATGLASVKFFTNGDTPVVHKEPHSAGRWPANLVHDGSDEVTRCFPVQKSPATYTRNVIGNSSPAPMNRANGTVDNRTIANGFGDTGSASRFFPALPLDAEDVEAARVMYCAKSSRNDRNTGLDDTCTVKYNVPRNGGALCKDVTMALVASLRKATSEQTATWRIGESGASITGLCQSATLSTTLTAISRITTSQILSLLTPLLTSAFTQAVNSEAANGGSPAASAESLSRWILSTTSGNPVLAPGVDLVVSQMLSTISDGANWKPLTNIHSTVKPTALMRWLVRLITPPGGVVLDPFMGSGSTGKAAIIEGFDFIGIELEAEYLDIARRRIEAAQLPLLATG